MDVARCPNGAKDYTTDIVKIQVIQRNDIKTQVVQACLVEVTGMTMHCGMHSHVSIASGGLSEYVYLNGAEGCKDTHRYKSLKVYQQTIGRLKGNATTTASVALMGYVNDERSCEGVVYAEEGHTWHSVVILATIKVHLQEYPAKVKLNL